MCIVHNVTHNTLSPHYCIPFSRIILPHYVTPAPRILGEQMKHFTSSPSADKVSCL